MSKPISPSNATLLYRQMVAANRKQVPFVDLFAALVEDPQLLGADAPAVAKTLIALQQGGKLSQALARLPDLYPAPTVALIQSAEDCDQLSEVLEALANEQSQLTRSGTAMRSALLWPSTVLFLGLIVLAIILIFVVPAFRDIYATFGSELPAPTQFLIGMSDLAVDYWWLIAGSIGAYFISRKRNLFPPYFGHLHEQLSMRLPFVRDYISRAIGAQLLQWFVLCQRHPTMLKHALHHVMCTTKWQVLKSMLTELQSRVAAGQSPGQALNHLAPLPPRMGMQVRLGEKFGDGGNALELALETVEFELSHALLRYERGTFLVSYVVIGLFVGFVVISLYLPIFKLGSIA